jgi:DNA-binding MarR family transcriptional regulator
MSELYADTDRPGVLLIAAPHDRVPLVEAVRAAGGRVAGEFSWEIGVVRGQVVTAIVAAAADTPDAPLATVLSELAAVASLGDTAIVVTLSERQIDLVAGTLFGPGVELLCDPDPATLAGSVALALARRHDLLADTVREGEAERLRRLNDEVARIAEVLARLTSHAEHRPGAVADRSPPYGAPPSSVTVSAAEVRKTIRARRLRNLQFPDGLFEDPAWDMLLDLYAADLEGAQVSVSSLCIAAAVAPTTALRWIGRMTEAGLFERQPDPFDRRRAFMALSENARDRMQRYFGAVTQQGLMIA